MDKPNDTTEVWKPIRGWGGRYEVSNLGRVKGIDQARKKTTILKPYVRLGYETVTLTEMRGVHVLVADAFVSRRPKGKHCHHIDGRKRNNIPSNLQWATPMENVHHAIRMGLTPTGNRHWSKTQPERWKNRRVHRRLTEAIVRRIRERSSNGEKDKDIAKDYDIKRETARDIRMGKVWRHILASSPPVSPSKGTLL